jgi:hypothetical protein
MKTIHINPQSKGSLGKSFETETRVSFLDAIGVAWHGYDLDDRHSTFRDRHADRVELFSLEGGAKDAILRLMARALERPETVILIDCRAQADLLIREAFDSLGIFQRARGAGCRVVISLFPSDDNESLRNLAEIARWGAGRANFIIVRNPAKARAHIFDGSPMRESLISKLEAKEIQIPEITTTSIQALERLEREQKRALPFGDFADGVQGVDPLITGEFAFLLSRMARQYTEIAGVLLPESELPKVPKPTTAKRKEETTNPLDLSLS